MDKKAYKDKDWLYDHYITRGTSTAEMCRLSGVTKETILKYLKKYEIPIRKKSVAIETPINNKSVLEEELFVNKLSYSMICDKYGVDKNKIRRLIKKHDIKINLSDRCKTFARKGKDNPNYKGDYKYCVCGKKINKAYKNCIDHRDLSGKNNGMYGKTHTKAVRKKLSKLNTERLKNNNPMNNPDSVKKIRLKKIKRINDSLGAGFQVLPAYNKSSIKHIEKVATDMGITDLQHAENGGEFHIKELGYWVDGYSKEKNIVIEYDERAHFNLDGSLKEKDRRRQKEIEEHLGCKFIRIKYDRI